MRLLLAESYRYAPERGWYYHPPFLPAEALSKEVKNGKIDRKLHFPVEDLYPDGKPAGQIGQEVYGCGVSFAFVTNAYHRTEGAPFLTYCDYPLRDKRDEDGRSTFAICGSEQGECTLAFLSDGRKTFTVPELWTNGERQPQKDRHTVKGASQIEIRWKRRESK